MCGRSSRRRHRRTPTRGLPDPENATGLTTVALGFYLRSRRIRPADRESSYRAVERLIATSAELVDEGEFAAVGQLLADATFVGGAGTVSGGGAIEKMLRDNVIVYDDGAPRTKHITTQSQTMTQPVAGISITGYTTSAATAGPRD